MCSYILLHFTHSCYNVVEAVDDCLCFLVVSCLNVMRDMF